jgi:hypothetical protein
MPTDQRQPTADDADDNVSAPRLRNVSICGAALVGIFLLLHWLSPPYEYGSELPRPTLLVTGLLFAAGVIAFFGLTNALKVPVHQRKTLLLLILSFALSTRLIAVFTCPILEIDYYRYLWDGKVTVEGISPYHFSPEQILESNSEGTGSLGRLSRLSLRSESNHAILSRIHFKEYTTIYPPVSQAVFATVMACVPDSASVPVHLLAMKSVLVLFELGTLLLVWFLLKRLDRNVGWLIVYAWNPLVIKEIANSGHLDSIAAFLMMLSIVLLVSWQLSGIAKATTGKTIAWLLASGVVLGLGVGAKLFPAVLFPALAIYIARSSWGKAVLFALVFAAVAMLTLWPMLRPIVNGGQSSAAQPPIAKRPLAESPAAKSQQGAVGFFSHWRMNDTVFSFVYLNLKNSSRVDAQTPWYVLTNKGFRKDFDQWCRSHVVGGDNPAFFCTKVLTLGLFLAFYCWQLLKIYRAQNFRGRFETADDVGRASDFMRRLVLILTFFLFLQPTVNPWYFVWLLPLVSFSNNRGWTLVGGLLLTYYGRFWFQSLAGEFDFGGRKYSGEGIYDHVVVWIVLLAVVGTLAFFKGSNSNNRSMAEGN